METKNYTQVLIDGKIYTLGGSEDEAYLQRTASYVNEKNMQLRGIPGFSKQSADYQQVMIQLNIADDYFKALDHSEQMEEERNRMEKESYSLKHELVSTQMKLEAVLKDLEERQVQLEETASHLAKLERENRNLTRQNERLSQEPQIEGYKKDSIGGMSHGFVWGILSLSLKRTGEKCGFGSVKRPGKAEIT